MESACQSNEREFEICPQVRVAEKLREVVRSGDLGQLDVVDEEGYVRGQSVAVGRVRVAPWPASLSSQMRPPIISTSSLATAKPSPVPPYFRLAELSACSKALKMRSRRSAGMPIPVSATEKCSVLPGPPSSGSPGWTDGDGVARAVRIVAPRRAR